MKKRLFIFVLSVLCLMSSCSVLPIPQKNDNIEEDPVKSMFIGSGTMFSDFFFDAYSSGTELGFSDFDQLRSAPLREDSALLSVNSLSVLGRELASKDKKISISVNSLRDNEKDLSYNLTDVIYGSEKLSAVFFASDNSSLAAFSCLADTYVNFPYNASIKNVIIEFLSSDAVSTDRFSLSRSDCRHGDSVIKDTQKITLDLSGIDLSSLFSDIFDCFDFLFRFSDEKNHILNNLSSPPGTGVTVYIKDGKTVCAEVIFTVSGTEYRATVFLDASNSYQSAKISFTKGTSPNTRIFNFDFIQVTNNDAKSGTVSAVFFPKAIFEDTEDLPSEITLDAEFETVISGNRQNCTMAAEFKYTLHGITASYKLPISIVTELFDGVFTASVSLSAENPEISEFDARISLTLSAAKSLDIPVISPQNILSVQTADQADEFLSSLFLEFGKKCPNLRYLIFKNYVSQEQEPLNILTAKSEESGETFIFFVNSLNGFSFSGDGEYVKEFTYSENGDVLLIAETSGNGKYTLYTSSAEKNVCDDGSLLLTEQDGTVWRLFPSDGIGYFSKPVTFSASVDENRTSGELSIFFADSSPMLERSSFTLKNGVLAFNNNEYKYDLY